MGIQTRNKVIVVIGSGSIGQAIARRISAGKHIVLGDVRQENADAAANTLSDAGFTVTTAKVDGLNRSGILPHRRWRFSPSTARFRIAPGAPGRGRK